MGVTYKLKQEVIDLIVQKKKEDPSLSCRKLAVLLEEAFHLNVSKSSINAVIKEFKLSSPVGRKSINPTKNFYIPPEKKQQLLSQVVPFLPPSIIPDAPEASESVLEEAQAFEDPINIEESVVPEPLRLRQDPLRCVNEAPVVTRQESAAQEPVFVWSEEKGILWEKAGLYFVWGLMQDLLQQSIIGGILATAADIDRERARILEAAVFLHVFGVAAAAEFHGASVDALWNMLEIDPAKGVRVLGDFLGKDLNVPSIGMLLEVELQAALAMTSYLKCSTPHGKSFCLTGGLTKILGPATSVDPAPVFKAVRDAVDLFVLRKQPVVLNMLGENIFAAQESLAFFSGQEDRLDKIELMAANNEKIWELVLNPVDQRDVLAVFEYNDEIAEKVVFETIDNPKTYYDAYSDEKYFLMEGVWSGFDEGRAWRAIVVQKDGTSVKFIVLCNADPIKINMINILEFCLEKPFFSLRNRPISHENMGFNIQSSAILRKKQDIFGLFKDIFELFNKILVKKLSFQDLKTDEMMQIYNLSGYVQHRNKDVLVRFVIPSNFSATTLLGSMVAMFGHGTLIDQNSNKYYFSIEK
jgi:hypothetical protein